MIVRLYKLLEDGQDLVISGINHEANLGENLYYSGTAGAAREAVIHHVPALAVSLCSKRANSDFAPSARLTQPRTAVFLAERATHGSRNGDRRRLP